MLIAIDGNEANVSKRVGIGEYAFELLRYFNKFKVSNIKFQIYLKDKPLSDMPEESDDWIYEIIGPKKFWTQFGLPLKLFLQNPKPDIFFSPSHYAPRFSPVPTAISIMDVSYLYFPELFAKRDLYQLIHWTAYSARKAGKIFTISNSSKNDIINHYKVAVEKVVVTYPGIKPDLPIMSEKSLESLKNKYQIKGKYILFVGTIQPRKNVARLIEAFCQVAKKHEDIDLVVVGKKGWLYEPIFQKPEELKIPEKVKFLDFVSDENLHLLYKNALFFILPSLYEGFGLPVLEAMKSGCPVITSDISSLPEAGGKAALYVDPENVSDITKKMLLLIDDEKLRKDLVKKGYEHLKNFSWEKTAKKTLEVLREMVDNKNNER